MLNKYVWDNYLKAGGAAVVEMFRHNLAEDFTKDYAIEIRRMVSKYCPMNLELDQLQMHLNDLFDSLAPMDDSLEGQDIMVAEDDTLDETTDKTTDETLSFGEVIDLEMEDAYNEIWAHLKNENQNNPKARQADPTTNQVFGFFIRDLPGDSTDFAMRLPELFVPYYFQYNFNVLEIIADQFDIELPEIPTKKDYEGRFYYYGEICKALTRFRLENDLSPYELCAFLYDFAPNYIGGLESYIINELPDPRGAYFIGSSENDLALTDDPSDITIWQCNEDTRAGDMIVMYFTTPVSAVDSVWRACSVGFIDPFFYHYRATYISKRVKINRVSLNMMKGDPIISTLPIIRKNMLGINGIELFPSVYNHLMDMAGADLFRFQYEEDIGVGTIAREKDVENLLIKPLLKRLGYSEKHYTQQLYIEIGNHNHALIPDFVLLPNRSTGHASAFAIIEAKKTIPNEKFLDDTKTQARSYANQLKTRYSVIAAKEKVWVTSEKDDYSKTIFEATWAELNDPDTFYQLEKMIGFH